MSGKSNQRAGSKPPQSLTAISEVPIHVIRCDEIEGLVFFLCTCIWTQGQKPPEAYTHQPFPKKEKVYIFKEISGKALEGRERRER